MDESILYGRIDFIKPHSGAGKFGFESHEHRQRQAAAEYKKIYAWLCAAILSIFI